MVTQMKEESTTKREKYFYCYNTKLKRFLMKSGFSYVDRGISNKTGYPFWTFIMSSALKHSLKEYKAQK